MGWSCRREAGMTMDAIRNFCIQETGSSNTYWSKGNKYFFEIGREQRDGAITGTIHKFLDGNRCRKTSTLRIEPNGKISRGPAVLKKVPVYLLKIKDVRGVEITTLWENGDPTDDKLWDEVKAHHDSYKNGGLNEHITESVGFVPHPVEAKIVDVDGDVLLQWKASTFQVF